MKQNQQKMAQNVPQYVGMIPSLVQGKTHHGGAQGTTGGGSHHQQMSKSQYGSGHGHSQQNQQQQQQQMNALIISQSNVNMIGSGGPGPGGQGGQIGTTGGGAVGQPGVGRSASSGTNYASHKASKSQIQPVFSMKNRKVKNGSYSQQRTDRIEKIQNNFGSQSGLQAPSTNYGGTSQVNQNYGMARGDLGQANMNQYDGSGPGGSGNTNFSLNAVNQQMHQTSVGLQPQLQSQIKHQYASTQPSIGSQGFGGLSQSYQSAQNAKMKNQKNYQAKVQKARRLGSSHGISSQNHPQGQGGKSSQLNPNNQTILNLQQITGNTSHSHQASNNIAAVYSSNYKSNIMSSNASTSHPGQHIIHSSNPPSSGGNSRSKSVHQQQQQQNVYGIITAVNAAQQKQNAALGGNNGQPGGQGGHVTQSVHHNSTKSHHFSSNNPISVDPYHSQQSPQIGAFNYQNNLNATTAVMKQHPKTAKQQRSLSDQIGGTRRQQSHTGVIAKQSADQQQQPTSIVGQGKKSAKQQQNQTLTMSQNTKTNLLNFQQRMNVSQQQHHMIDGIGGSNPSNLIASASGQVLSGNQKQMQMNTQKFTHNQIKGSASQKDINVIAGNQGQHTQLNENLLSPKELGFLSQAAQHNQKQQNQSHSQMQKQFTQSSGQIQYNIGQHQLMHDRDNSRAQLNYHHQTQGQGQNPSGKPITTLQKNQINREKSPNGTMSTAVMATSNTALSQHTRNNDFQAHHSAKIAGHSLKSQSMHQIPQNTMPQSYSQAKFAIYDSALNNNFSSTGGADSGHQDNIFKRQQPQKLGQVHSISHLSGQGETQQMHTSGRVASGKRPESIGSKDASQVASKSNLNQQQISQRNGTPSNKHRRMSPKIQGYDNNASVDQLIQNSRQNNNHVQSLRGVNTDFHSQIGQGNSNFTNTTMPTYTGQRNTSQDSKAQVSAAPASGVNSNISQVGSSHLIDRKGHVNSFMDGKSLVGLVNQKTDGTNAISQSIKQIPIRPMKVRNQAGSFVEASRSFNLSLKDSHNLSQKVDKGHSGGDIQHLNYHQRGQSHQTAPENKAEQKIMAESQSKQGFHQRKEARIPSAGKKRTASGQGLTQIKRVPSGQRNKQSLNDPTPKSVGSSKQIQQEDIKKKESANLDNKEEQNGNIFKPRSSITNVRRSRNEGKATLPDAQNSDMLDAAGNPTSAGQSTSSLYKQEQINKKFKFHENASSSSREAQKPSITPKESKNNDMNKQHGSRNEIEEQGKSTVDQVTKSITPQNAHRKKRTGSGIDNENTKATDVTATTTTGLATSKDKDENTQASETGDKTSATDKTVQDRKAMFTVAPNAGLSGRNLYFNQIRNEINLSESGKCKSLPDYQNAKYSNKRNGLVAGYGANTNQGIVRNYNEDRVAIILNIMKPKSKNYESQQWPKCSFFGIYDGHGGAVCADFLRDYLHQFIIKDENFPQNPIQALRNGFREAERLFMEFAESQEKEAGEIDRSGSCAVVILIIDDMCYCANTGDSRAIMSADGGEKLFLLSTDHKPTDEIEMKRIIEQGGRIYQNSQVIQTNPSLGEVGKQMVYGPHRVFPGRLSVSRTIGDIEAKIEKYEGNANVVIADPDVTAFEIKDNHDFIVIGCDGVFDKLSSKDAIHIAWQKVLMEAAKSNVDKVDPQQTHQNCGHCVDGILRTAALRRTVDNVTCVVVAFDGFQKQLQKFISNNLDGTTVDVIEEIQLEPIPEYLSNTKMAPPSRKSGAPSDNSMLLLDDNQAQSESDNPLIGGRNIRGAGRDASGKKNNNGQGGAEKLLSEIAEEDDVSSVSENAQGRSGAAQNKVIDDQLGRVGKGSIHSITDQSLRDSNDDDQASLTERGQMKDKNKDSIEQKRRSQIVPQNSIGQAGSKKPTNSNNDGSATRPGESGRDKANATLTEAGSRSQLEDVDISVGLTKKY